MVLVAHLGLYGFLLVVWNMLVWYCGPAAYESEREGPSAAPGGALHHQVLMPGIAATYSTRGLCVHKCDKQWWPL